MFQMCVASQRTFCLTGKAGARVTTLAGVLLAALESDGQVYFTTPAGCAAVSVEGEAAVSAVFSAAPGAAGAGGVSPKRLEEVAEALHAPRYQSLPADLALEPGGFYDVFVPFGVYELDLSALTIARPAGDANDHALTVELRLLLSHDDVEITWPADMVWLERAAPTLQAEIFYQIVLRQDSWTLLGHVAYSYVCG